MTKKKLDCSFWFSKGIPAGLLFLILAFQPWIDLDYLIFPFLDQFGLPRPSTLIRYLIIPVLILWIYATQEKNKKRVLFAGGLMGIVLAAYFIMHVRVASQASQVLRLTDNFHFSLFTELTYCLTLTIPFALIYSFQCLHPERKVIEAVTAILSMSVAFPIVISDLFVFGQSTYLGYTEANIFSWFSGIYATVEPRRMACKFFFDEGNTVGILMFMLLPLLYYFFAINKDRKKKIFWSILIVVQSLAMLMLSTRVASYGTFLIPGVFIVVYLFDCLVLKHGKQSKWVMVFSVLVSLVSFMILPYTPMIQSQKIDEVNDNAVRGDDDLLQKGIDAYEERFRFNEGSREYEEFCLKAFEKSGIEDNLISSIPVMYYEDWYDYRKDPVFWSDYLFKVPLEERLNGRQFQTYFMNHKWNMATPEMRIFGMGYSSFMNGSILLEKDFVQQKYTLGKIGTLLMTLPWAVLVIVGGFTVLIRRKECLNLEVMILGMSLCCGLGSAYLSGHTLDQFLTTMFMAFISGILLNRVFYGKKEEETNE